MKSLMSAKFQNKLLSVGSFFCCQCAHNLLFSSCWEQHFILSNYKVSIFRATILQKDIVLSPQSKFGAGCTDDSETGIWDLHLADRFPDMTEALCIFVVA